MKNKQVTTYRQHEISRTKLESEVERAEREKHEKIARRLSKFVLKRITEGETDIKIGLLRGLRLGNLDEYRSGEVNDLVNEHLEEHDVEVDPYVLDMRDDYGGTTYRRVAVTRVGEIEPSDSSTYRRAKEQRNRRPFGWPFTVDVDVEALRIKEQDVVMLCREGDIDLNVRHLTDTQIDAETKRTTTLLSTKLDTMFGKYNEEVSTIDGVYKRVEFEIEKVPSLSGIPDEDSYKIIISWPAIDGLSTIAFVMLDDYTDEPIATINGKDLDKATSLKLINTVKQLVTRRSKTEITPR